MILKNLFFNLKLNTQLLQDFFNTCEPIAISGDLFELLELQLMLRLKD